MRIGYGPRSQYLDIVGGLSGGCHGGQLRRFGQIWTVPGSAFRAPGLGSTVLLMHSVRQHSAQIIRTPSTRLV